MNNVTKSFLTILLFFSTFVSAMAADRYQVYPLDKDTLVFEVPRSLVDNGSSLGFRNEAGQEVLFNINDGYNLSIFLDGVTADKKSIHLLPKRIEVSEWNYKVVFSDPKLVVGTKGNICIKRTDSAGSPAYGTDSTLCLGNDPADPADFLWGIRLEPKGFRLEWMRFSVSLSIDRQTVEIIIPQSIPKRFPVDDTATGQIAVADVKEVNLYVWNGSSWNISHQWHDRPGILFSAPPEGALWGIGITLLDGTIVPVDSKSSAWAPGWSITTTDIGQYHGFIVTAPPLVKMLSGVYGSTTNTPESTAYKGDDIHIWLNTENMESCTWNGVMGEMNKQLDIVNIQSDFTETIHCIGLDGSVHDDTIAITVLDRPVAAITAFGIYGETSPTPGTAYPKDPLHFWWNTSNMKACTLNGASVEANGDTAIANVITGTITENLSCTGYDGSVKTVSQTVTVIDKPSS